MNTVATERLKALAELFDWPVADLLDWYQNDMDDIERLPVNEVKFIVLDYIQYHAACRG